MKIIIDTNILFSLFLSTKSPLKDIFFNDNYTFYSPNYVFTELFKYKEKILKYSKVSENDFYLFINKIVERIHFVNEELVSLKSKKVSSDLCNDIDPMDIPFISLTIELDGYLWTGDLKLKESLKKKGFDKFF